MLRFLTLSDLKDFLAIRADSLRLSPTAFCASPDAYINPEETRRNLALPLSENLVMGYFDNESGKLVGIAGCLREKALKKRHKAVLWGVFVYEAYRGKGISRQLVEACINYYRQVRGITQINLSVTHLSEAAHHVYRDLGFVEYGREKNALIWDGQYLDEIFMSLDF